MRSCERKMIEKGIKASDLIMTHEDKIWSKFSNDKVDIGQALVNVIRTLNKALPLNKQMKALSIGSSHEPQFRILESAFRGGLYLVDIEKEALGIVEERIHRQYTYHVTPIHCDYTKVFLDCGNVESFLEKHLAKHRMNLITLHHSLYYCREESWHELFNNLYANLLAPTGAMHAVLMAAGTEHLYTTSWLYDHFVGKFFGQRNTQNLSKFRNSLKKDPLYRNAQIHFRKSRVYFMPDGFEKFMAVVWMILLYPNVHNYSPGQREEITRFMYKNFWAKKRPLEQMQEHLVVYRGVKFRGLV